MFEPKTGPLAGLHDLTNRVAVVTGAGSGIGRAVATRFAEAGASVLCLDLDEAAAEKSAAELRETAGANGRVLARRADVLNRDELHVAADAAVREWGRVDILVNSAGIFPPTPFFDMTPAQWEKVLATNVTGGFLAAQACAPRMHDTAGGGTIVNIASKSAFQPTKGLAHYAASKGGVVMMTKALALELAPLGVRVNAVAPGGVETEGARRTNESLLQQDTAATGKAATFGARCPMGRSATADEIARIVLFLATDWSAYMTGSTVLADGGYMLT
jgi:NAD(P)-dependent dehydrogenase (short-subunit alcohol dehydrogenase family)